MRALPGLILAVLLLWPTASLASDRLLDFWAEETRTFGVAHAGQFVDHNTEARRHVDYAGNGALTFDQADRRVGDFSLVYAPAQARMPERFGFSASLWGQSWTLSRDMRLRLWVRVEDANPARGWIVRLVDQDGDVATGALAGIGARWREASVSLASFDAPSGFDWRAVRLVEFQASFSESARVHLDGVRFVGGGETIGVTDKSLDQRMAEAAASRDARIAHAFGLRVGSARGERGIPLSPNEAAPAPLNSAFAMLMSNQDLEAANALLIEALNRSSELNVWSLSDTPLYIRFYYMFSSRAGRYPGRLTPQAERLLLETLWDRTVVKNDIAMTRESTWWMDGSENHDLNAKASSLVTSRIFMNEPEFRDRIYPDYGFGGSYHYGHAGYYGPGVEASERHAGGRANRADGNRYNAADHYAAWVGYFRTYFRERAQRGFFLEYGSPTYSKHSLNFIDLVYQYSGDAELQRLGGDFLTLFWADYAQVSIAGIRGGPKTRHGGVGGTDDRGTADLVSFELGAPASAGLWSYWGLVNDYRLPPIVWRMLLDREGMGSFTYLSRGIGEEQDVWPRPLGLERTLMVDTNSRFLRSTYVTPDYTLGTQMDHPAAVHSHLSIAARWHGMTVAQSPGARIVPVGLPVGRTVNGQPAPEHDTEIMLRTAHRERTLIVQQARSWRAVHPEWYPSNASRYNKDIGIWLGNAWDQRVERGGWVFVREGNAYAAVRPVLWDEEFERARPRTGEGNQIFFHTPDDIPTVRLCTRCYEWNEAGTIMRLHDRFAPVIIETARASEYRSFEAFIADVLNNPIALYKTVVPGFHILVYTGLGANAPEIVFNAGSDEIPTIGGEYINYSYPMTYDSPHLRSEYTSGVISLTFGDERLVLDFTE